MMYPWKNKNSSRRQQQQQQQQQQRAPGSSSPIRTSRGYHTRSTSVGDCTDINSQNPNDGMMDSVFGCIFSDDEVTVTRDGGYLYGGGNGNNSSSDGDGDENIEVSSNKRDSYADNSNEQGFEMHHDGRPRRNSSSCMNWKGRLSSSKSVRSSSAGTVITTPNNNNNTMDDDDDDSSNNNNIVRLKPAQHKTPGFWATLMAEFCNPQSQDWYSVRDTVTGRRLDFAASFAPPPTLGVILMKLSSTLLVVGTMAFSIWDFYLQQQQHDEQQQQLYLWLSYFTNWSLFMAAIYQLLSLSNTLCSTRGMAFAPPTEHVAGRIKWTWIFFTIALNSQVLAALLFWIAWFQSSQYKHVWTTSGISSLQDDPADSAQSMGFYYLTIVPHSLTLLAVAMDGLVVNRIPLRLIHWWGWILGFNLLYIAWTMIRSLVLNNDAFFGTNNTIPLTEYGYLDNKYNDVNNNNGTSSLLVSLNETTASNTNFNLLDNYTMDSINNMDSSYGSAAATSSSSTALYNGGMLLNWQDNWPLALIQSLIICFAISPTVYILLWILSLYTWPCCCAKDRRRYVVNNHLNITIQEIEGGRPAGSSG